jgi:hypothetical protein
MSTPKTNITPLMVQSWMGDGFDRSTRWQNTALESCFKIIAGVANGQYKINLLRDDILVATDNDRDERKGR